MSEDSWLESARSAFVRRLAQRVSGMTSVAASERIINAELTRFLRDIGANELPDLDMMESLADDDCLRLAGLDHLNDDGD